MPFGQRQQICCERIEITASRDTLADLPPLLLALAAPDLPVVVWCRSLSILHDGAFPALVSAAHKLIVDSASFPDPCSALEWLAGVSRRCLALADLEWTRLTPWRETIARLFDEPGRWLRLRGIRDLCICCKGPRTTVSAYYLAAWLRDAIGADTAPLCKFQVSGEEAMPELERVHLAGPDWDAALQLAEDRSLEVRTDSQAARLCLPAISDCSLLSEELKIAGSDPIYERSLALARGIAAGQGDLP
jgi:glucose-6-phosphate dehydrogenase assembly protein OpcA